MSTPSRGHGTRRRLTVGRQGAQEQAREVERLGRYPEEMRRNGHEHHDDRRSSSPLARDARRSPPGGEVVIVRAGKPVGPARGAGLDQRDATFSAAVKDSFTMVEGLGSTRYDWTAT